MVILHYNKGQTCSLNHLKIFFRTPIGLSKGVNVFRRQLLIEISRVDISRSDIIILVDFRFLDFFLESFQDLPSSIKTSKILTLVVSNNGKVMRNNENTIHNFSNDLISGPEPRPKYWCPMDNFWVVLGLAWDD